MFIHTSTVEHALATLKTKYDNVCITPVPYDMNTIYQKKFKSGHQHRTSILSDVPGALSLKINYVFCMMIRTLIYILSKVISDGLSFYQAKSPFIESFHPRDRLHNNCYYPPYWCTTFSVQQQHKIKY